MLKILFSPSEGKNIGGDSKEKELFGALNARDEILQEYKKIVLSGDEQLVKELFGIKKSVECQNYIDALTDSNLMPALERYSGVAYEYLKFSSLSKNEQEYLKKNTIIFSNLYGPLLGGDPILNYKVKQGNNIGDIVPDKFYKERFSYQLDLYLGQHEILDLRAGYYDKFYKTSNTYTTLKFLKGGKSVSHWAKAYRGIVLREIAKQNITSLEELNSLKIEGLEVLEIQVTKNKTQIIYNILS